MLTKEEAEARGWLFTDAEIAAKKGSTVYKGNAWEVLARIEKVEAKNELESERAENAQSARAKEEIDVILTRIRRLGKEYQERPSLDIADKIEEAFDELDSQPIEALQAHTNFKKHIKSIQAAISDAESDAKVESVS